MMSALSLGAGDEGTAEEAAGGAGSEDPVVAEIFLMGDHGLRWQVADGPQAHDGSLQLRPAPVQLPTKTCQPARCGRLLPQGYATR